MTVEQLNTLLTKFAAFDPMAEVEPCMSEDFSDIEIHGRALPDSLADLPAVRRLGPGYFSIDVGTIIIDSARFT